MKQLILLAAILSFASNTILVAEPVSTSKSGKNRVITRADLADKIKGGWAAKMAGVAYGAPTEFRACGKLVDVIPPWTPERISNVIVQDDLYVQMTFAAVLDKVGLGATCEQFGEAFRDSKYALWHANAGARRALNNGIKAPWSGHPKYNAHADDIDFQIEADFIGLMCPGLPRTANDYCDRVGHVMNYGDGVYGGMWLCGMYSAAFFESDPRKIVEAGLATIPEKSQYSQLIRDILRWHEEDPNNWTNCWKKLQEKWDKDDVCPEGALTAFNIDAKLNGGYIALGLLYGNGDLDRTLEISTRAGQDSDCNPGNAGGVLGVVLGYKKVPEKWVSGIPGILNSKFDYTDYTFNDILRLTEERALELIKKAGGKVTDTEVIIPLQKPKAAKLEQWIPGIPEKRIAWNDPAWEWQGDWAHEKKGRSSSSPQSEAIIKFNGVAVFLTGFVYEYGGRADVYLDDKKSKRILDSYVAKGTHDDVLWYAYDLKPGEHTLRIVPQGAADPRSGGKAVTIGQAIVFGKKSR